MIAEAKGMGARGRGLSWTGALARPLRPELSAQGKAAPRAGVAVCPRALSRCPAPLGTGVPVPERLQLPPVWRMRVEGAAGAATFGLPAQPLPPSSRGFIFFLLLLLFLWPDPPPPLSLKAPPRPGQLRGASAQVTFPAAVTLGHAKVGEEEGDKNSCSNSAQTFLPLKQRGFKQTPHPQTENGKRPVSPRRGTISCSWGNF